MDAMTDLVYLLLISGEMRIMKSSLGSQKGASTIQRCSVGNQKGAITIDSAQQ